MYGLGPAYEVGKSTLAARSVPSHSNDSLELLFHIDPTSSVIRVANSQWLDREVLCPFASGNNKECSLAYAVSISAKAKTPLRLTPQQSWIRVKIVVEDINDNAPRFQAINDSELATASQTACNLHLQLSEAVQIGTKLKLPDAIDLDSQANGLPIYQFTCQDPDQVGDTFTLRQSRAENGVNRIWLLLSNPLDYERQAAYNCTLTACDSGTPILCSSLHVCITVHDSYFRVDSKTGDLILKRRLTGGTKYHFWAEARDGGEPESRSARIPVSVLVTDVNNHAPRIDVLPAAVRVQVGGKSTTAGDSVRSVMSQVRSAPCELTYGFADSSEGNRACDQHSLVRIFEDNIAPSSIAFLRVSDEDKGENARESLPVGSNVIQLGVKDQDSLPRGSSKASPAVVTDLLLLKFSLDSNKTLPFAIDTLSGRIYSTEQLDAETRTEYNLTSPMKGFICKYMLPIVAPY
ncbi:unnamed protein product [Dibothriocephalus latus]|uniref:Cadherin domain-containing protein n=1 Tax=Dibothriocephalus latus TaxID=60516 RepID=A0A3P7KX83_DIBLA|nr:unnamed protein product [Dibothriocephalus latus]